MAITLDDAIPKREIHAPSIVVQDSTQSITHDETKIETTKVQYYNYFKIGSILVGTC